MAAAGLDKLVRHLRSLAAIGHFRSFTDAQLLERFVSANDEIAFEVLVRRHARLVFGACRRALGRGPDAEDAFQATLLVLARKAGSIRREASVAGWLYSVAHRVARKLQTRLARRRRREQTEIDLEAIAEDTSMANDPAQQAGWRELGLALDKEVQRLPKKNREALVLCHLEGLSAVDAAKRLGCPQSTLKSRLERARELLRQRLARRGVCLSSAGVAVLFAEHTVRAAVPPKVLHAAVQAAIAYAAKPVVSALVSAQAAALAQGMLKTATVAKVSLVMVALLTTVAVGFGTAMGPGEKSGTGTIGDIVVAAQIPNPQPEGAKARVDSLGDSLPPGAVARLGTLRFKHGVGNYSNEPFFRMLKRAGGSHQIQATAYSSDGTRIVSLANFAGVHVWDATTGKVLDGPWEVVEHRKFPLAVTLSPEGAVLAAVYRT
jgi:RNA polymerase sigma factor (sigma-70 family)